MSFAYVESPRLSEHLSRKDGRGGSAEDESQAVAERRREVGMLQEIELRCDARIISLVIYAIGIVFYAFDSRFRLWHCIWQLFAIGGCLAHYIAIAFYVL